MTRPHKTACAATGRIPARLLCGAWALAGALCLTPASAAEPGIPTMALEEAIAAALRNNLRLAQGVLEVQQREIQVDLARSAFDVTLGPFARMAAPDGQTEAAYGLQAVKPLVQGATVGASATVRDNPVETVLAVELTQPLFRRFGRSVAEEPIHAEADQLRASRRIWEARKADLILEIVSLFETITRLDAQAAFEQGFLQHMERLATLTRTRERQGRATRMDTLRVDLQRGEAEIRLINIRERRGVAVRELAEAVGLDVRQEIAPTPPPTLEAVLPDSETAIATAVRHRMDMAQVLDDALIVDRRGAVTDRNRWPDVTVGLSYLQKYRNETHLLSDQDESAWYASASMDGTPWQRANRLARTQADLERQAARARIEITRQTLVQDVLLALAECRRTGADLAVAERNRDLAIHSARLGRRFYTSGRTDGLTLSDAESQLAASETRLLDARSAARFSRYALSHTLGTLIEHPADLSPGPQKEFIP